MCSHGGSVPNTRREEREVREWGHAYIPIPIPSHPFPSLPSAFAFAWAVPCRGSDTSSVLRCGAPSIPPSFLYFLLYLLPSLLACCLPSINLSIQVYQASRVACTHGAPSRCFACMPPFQCASAPGGLIPSLSSFSFPFSIALFVCRFLFAFFVPHYYPMRLFILHLPDLEASSTCWSSRRLLCVLLPPWIFRFAKTYLSFNICCLVMVHTLAHTAPIHRMSWIAPTFCVFGSQLTCRRVLRDRNGANIGWQKTIYVLRGRSSDHLSPYHSTLGRVCHAITWWAIF